MKASETQQRRHPVVTVVKRSGDKTIKVQIKNRVIVPIYKKYINQDRYRLVHDENNIANVGDKVEIRESRPNSKKKSWEVVKVTEKAKES